jgi:hypothetical protein
MDPNLFRQDIKKICLLIAYQQSLSSSQKNCRLSPLWTNLGKELSQPSGISYPKESVSINNTSFLMTLPFIINKNLQSTVTTIIYPMRGPVTQGQTLKRKILE